MMKQETITTFSCDLEGCKTDVSTKKYWLDFLTDMKAWGWLRVLSSSPYPSVPGQWGWAITLYFCPEHASIGESKSFVVLKGKDHKKQPNYTAVYAERVAI